MGYIGIMENKMETTIMGLYELYNGESNGKENGNEMETGFI